MALAWIGRGSFGPEELDEALATARAERVNRTEDYLLGMPLLPDYLEEALDRLGYSVEDAEEDVALARLRLDDQSQHFGRVTRRICDRVEHVLDTIAFDQKRESFQVALDRRLGSWVKQAPRRTGPRRRSGSETASAAARPSRADSPSFGGSSRKS